MNTNIASLINPCIPVPGEDPRKTVSREVRPVPDRYRNSIGKYRIVRLADCVSCGRCEEVCGYGVHTKPEGYALMTRPRDHLCIGPACSEHGRSCLDECPRKALRMRLNPNLECLGDPRWTADLILATWYQAAPAEFRRLTWNIGMALREEGSTGSASGSRWKDPAAC